MSNMDYNRTVSGGGARPKVSFNNTYNFDNFVKSYTKTNSNPSATSLTNSDGTMDLNFFLEDNLTKDYAPTAIMYEPLAHTGINPEVVIFAGDGGVSNEPPETLEPTIDSGSTYNHFGTDSNLLDYEMTEEDIKNKISDNNELISILDEQIAYYEQMQDDVYIDAVGWYNDFYFNFKEDFWGSLFRCLCGAPSNDMCLSMFKCASDEEFFEISGYKKEEYNAAETNIMIMEQYRKSLANENASLKYLQITEESGYSSFTYTAKGYDSIKGTYGDYISKEIYNNMTEEEKKMLQYLESKYGKDKAITYLKDMEDIWNQRAGYLRAQERIDSLDTTDEGKLKEELGNILGVSGDGFVDGWNSFWEGIVLAFTADGKMSADQYERMFYLSYLQQNTQDLDFWYNTGSAVGTMTPIVGLTTISAIVCPYLSEGVAAVVGTATPYVAGSIMAVSSFGNTMDQTLYSGYSRDVAFIYSLCVAGSDALLEVLLGGINGLGVSPKIGKNFLVQFFGQIGKEGIQEGLQTIIEMGIFDSLILGKEINIDEMGAATLESVLIGMIVAGSMNVASGSVTMLANLSIGGISYHLDATQLKQALDLSKNNNIPLAEAIKQIGKVQQVQEYIKAGDLASVNNYLKSLPTKDALAFLKSLDPDLQKAYNDANGGINVGNLKINGNAAVLTPYDQNVRYYELLSLGHTETEIMAIMLDEFATKYQDPTWAPKEHIMDSMKESYDKLNDADKANLSYEEYLKIKLQVIPFDPATQMPATYQEFVNIMENTDSCTGYYSPNDLRRLLGIGLYGDTVDFGNGLGRAENKNKNLDSAYFAIPTSEVTYPPNWNSMSLDEQTKWLADRIGLDKGPYQNGYIEIVIDESLYGDDWTYSTPVTQGSNMMYTPGMHTSGASYEVILPRIEGIVEYIDPSIELDLNNAKDNMEIFDIFQDALNNGKIKLKDGITFIFHD